MTILLNNVYLILYQGGIQVGGNNYNLEKTTDLLQVTDLL